MLPRNANRSILRAFTPYILKILEKEKSPHHPLLGTPEIAPPPPAAISWITPSVVYHKDLY
jgi:hypothetical protein